MSQENRKIIGIQLKSSEDNAPQSADYSPAQTSGSVKVEFDPDQLNVSLFALLQGRLGQLYRQMHKLVSIQYLYH